ncbi:receptor-like protein kinase [Musa troglodytarum]|uniref:CASP-like protein n=1 Tax=Musa troglodytarum TaxID=320322 RepID=A0A9E7LG21_9LILI|nr:receptor-like protein kinase [Musa troglodytarum]
MFVSRPAVQPVEAPSPANAAENPPRLRMKDIQGMPGTAGGLALRLSQFVFAVAALGVMESTNNFGFVTVFCYLIAAAITQSLWSISLAFLDIYALLVKRCLRNPRALCIFTIGDGITSTLTFSAACASAGITILLRGNGSICSHEHCTSFESAIAIAFISWFQSYTGNMVLDCVGAANDSSNLGYSCHGDTHHSCASYLTFRSQDAYRTPQEIADLLGADAASVAAINGIEDTTSAVPQGELVLVPTTCSCSGLYYQHNVSYTVKPGDTYFTVANDTYQGLSTCRALIAQNPYDPLNISIGARFVVPLRCACPTEDQVAGGIKYLLTYLVTWADDLSSIARRFHSELLFLLMYPNNLTANATLYPFSTLLVPLGEEPTRVSEPAASPPPPLAEASATITKTNLRIKISIRFFDV